MLFICPDVAINRLYSVAQKLPNNLPAALPLKISVPASVIFCRAIYITLKRCFEFWPCFSAFNGLFSARN